MKYSVNSYEMPITLSDRNIYGKIFLPQGKNTPMKTIILSHGYNSSHEYLCDLAYALAEMGVLAYCYDFCGGSVISKSSGSSLDMSIETEISDLNAVIEFVSKLEQVDTDNIFLYGESQGGFVSALTADDRIKGVYLLYPAFCIPDDWEKRKNEGMSEIVECMGMNLSQKFYQGLPKYNVFEHIGKYKGAVKIYHGTDDTLVNSDYAKKANDSFKNSTLTLFENEGHGFSHNARQRLIQMICVDFK